MYFSLLHAPTPSLLKAFWPALESMRLKMPKRSLVKFYS